MKNILILITVYTIQIFSQSEDKSFYAFKQQLVENIESNETSEPNLALEDVKKKKSAGLAILYSMVLPGMGELYADSYDSGIYFTVADGVLWGTYVGMNIYGNWQKDRYINYAVNKGGINIDSKDETYYATISQYMSIDEFNDQKAFERNYTEMYNNTEVFYWNWNTNDERKEYRQMWESSEQTFNNVRFVVGALLLNRVVSAINAVRLVSRYNNKLSQEVGWNVSVGLQNMPDNSSAYNINFITSF
jgi:hypothetical protein